MPALTMEAFGAKHWCANQSVPQAATALGALLLANQLAGRIYQKHVPPAEPACYGRYCFRCRPSPGNQICIRHCLQIQELARMLD